MDANELTYLTVLDFEATCGNDLDPDFDSTKQEIIEIPVSIVSLSDREVVDSFGTFVRPVHQPTLTDFCTELTSITQSDVDDAPTITEAMDELIGWLDEHDLTVENCCVATCGDWDLRRMWPKQVSLTPDLETPELFQRWCNLKVIYSRHTGKKRTGMMGMLRALDVEHVGHHHRGADDVRNLCNLVIELLERGAEFEATWDADNREREREHYETRLLAAQESVVEANEELESLPESVDDEVGDRIRKRIERLEAEVERTRLYLRVFSMAEQAPAG